MRRSAKGHALEDGGYARRTSIFLVNDWVRGLKVHA